MSKYNTDGIARRHIALSAIDDNLVDDLHGDTMGVEACVYDYPDATVGNQCYHVVFCPDVMRGGIVLVGSGSSGDTSWTDASSPDEVFELYLADEMHP